MNELNRLWEISAADNLTEINRSKLDLEKRIETWLIKDIDILSPDFLVIGQQVLTAYNKSIDVLCVDRSGNLVIVELKRDLTPRDVTAQALDYASWVKDLGAEEIKHIASEHFKGQNTLDKAFAERFKQQLPDTINEHHAMRVVASEIDNSTERIIRYLSETYGVDINAVTFQFYKTQEGREFLLRTFAVPPEEVETATARNDSKRTKIKWNWESFMGDAEMRGLDQSSISVMEKFLKLCESLSLGISWGHGKEMGTVNIAHPALSNNFLSLFANGNLYFSFGNFKNSPDEVKFRDKMKELVTGKLGFQVTADYERRYPGYAIAMWSPKLDDVEEVIRELVATPISATTTLPALVDEEKVGVPA